MEKEMYDLEVMGGLLDKLYDQRLTLKEFFNELYIFFDELYDFLGRCDEFMEDDNPVNYRSLLTSQDVEYFRTRIKELWEKL